MDTTGTELVEGSDDRRVYSEPELTVEGHLEELTMIPTYLLEAYG